jgi:outer membrane protein assembly factor BamB
MKGLRTLIAGSLCALAAPAFAGDIYVGTSIGEVFRHTSMGSSQVFPSMCTAIDSMAGDGRTLYVADTFGSVFIVRTTEGNSMTSIFLPAAANAMAIHNGMLIVGSADGWIRRVDPQTGAVVGSWQVNSSVEALAVVGDTVYAGGHNTFIYKGHAVTGGFQMFSACFGQVNSMAVNGNELLAGGLNGVVYRFNRTTSGFIGQFPVVNSDNAAIAMDGGTLWVVDSAGFIRRVNPTTGAVLFSTAMCTNITAMSALPECIADYNGDAFLNITDFVAFQNSFAAREPRADIDASGSLNVNDFITFMNRFAGGCP